MATKKTDINTQSTTGDITADAFMNNMKNMLEKSAGVVSSYDTQIESSINEAIKGQQGAAKANQARVESAFTREQTYAADAGSSQALTANEARRGFATNTGILKQIYQDTDKNIKDLEMRKQELIMQGNADAASKISDLQLQSVQFRQQAAQQAYSNMLSMANFGLAAKQEQRMGQAQTFQEKQALGNIALQFGLKVEPGDDLDSMIAKAAPFASEKQQLELAQARQSIAESQARITEMYKKNQAPAGISNEDLMTLAENNLKGEAPPVFETEAERAKYLRVYNKLQSDKENIAKSSTSQFTNKSEYTDAMKAQGVPDDVIAQYKDKVKSKPLVTGSQVSSFLGGAVNNFTKQNSTIGAGGVGFDVGSWLNSFNKK